MGGKGETGLGRNIEALEAYRHGRSVDPFSMDFYDATAAVYLAQAFLEARKISQPRSLNPRFSHPHAFRSGKVRENLGTYECVPTRAPPSPNTVSSRRPVDASVCPPVFAPRRRASLLGV